MVNYYEDYLDEDVAYFLGLLTMRGIIRDSGGIRQIILEFPFKDLEAKGIKKVFDRPTELIVNLYKIRNRINELLEVHIREEVELHSLKMIAEFPKRTIAWRDVEFLMQGKKSFREFEVPQQIFMAPVSVAKEYIRGIVDTGASVGKSCDAWGSPRGRLFIHINLENWKLPMQLCSLLQKRLKIPVDQVLWAHPNLRDPDMKKYKSGAKEFWAKEHQLRIYNTAFKSIGFYLKHKQEIFEEMLEYQLKKIGEKANSFCNPSKKLQRKRKKRIEHKEESSQRLPKVLRGKHFNCSYEICKELGCTQ